MPRVERPSSNVAMAQAPSLSRVTSLGPGALQPRRRAACRWRTLRFPVVARHRRDNKGDAAVQNFEVFKVERDDGHVMATKFVRLATAVLPRGEIRFEMQFPVGELNRAFNIPGPGELVENPDVIAAIKYAEETGFPLQKLEAHSNQGGMRLHLEMHGDSPSPPTLRCQFNPGPKVQDLLKTVAIKAREEFRVHNARATRIAGLDDVSAALIAERESSVNDLRAATARLGELLAEATREFTRRMAEREQISQTQADALLTSAKASIDEERKQLAAERDAFKAEVASYDHASRMHKRRAIEKEQLESATKERGVLSAITAVPVHLASTVVIAATSYAAYHFGTTLSTTTGTDAPRWDHIAPFTASIIVLSSTLIFYLRWIGAWVHETSRVRENHRKFNLDSHRARWLAELVFEWKDGGQTQFPPELLTAYSRTLFEPVALDDSREFHPVAQAIAAVTDVKTARVRQKTRAGETEVEVDRGDGGRGG